MIEKSDLNGNLNLFFFDVLAAVSYFYRVIDQQGESKSETSATIFQ